jgi:phytoene/squalene synthetase
VLRSVAVLARQGRCLLPEDMLAVHELSPEAVIAAPHGSAVRLVKTELGVRYWVGRVD